MHPINLLRKQHGNVQGLFKARDFSALLVLDGSCLKLRLPLCSFEAVSELVQPAVYELIQTKLATVAAAKADRERLHFSRLIACERRPRGVQWEPRRHRDFGPLFRGTVRTVLALGLRDSANRPRRPQALVWKLPRDVVVRVLKYL